MVWRSFYGMCINHPTLTAADFAHPDTDDSAPAAEAPVKETVEA
jgi:hypothetical protein